MSRLVVIAPDGVQTEHKLRAINTLGRHPGQNVQILDRVVSKKHALITFVENAYWLQDMGSRNGTFVNGDQIQGRTRLCNRDSITLGATRIIFTDEAEEADQFATRQVTINPRFTHETAIRSRLQPADEEEQHFLPEVEVAGENEIRSDYEKLRLAFELNKAIGSELDVDVLLQKILEKAFEFTTADRGVILLLDDEGVPKARAVKHRSGKGDQGQFELSQTILNEVINEHNAVLSSDATMDSRFGHSHSIILQGIRSTICVPLLHGGDLMGMIHLDTQVATGVFTEKDLQILTVFANQAAVQLANARLAKLAEKEAIARANLSRLLSPNLVEEVVRGNKALGKGGQLRQATVLFSDIRGFTPMCEQLDPQSIVSMLNEYFEIMVEIVFHHEGTLDKFIGDELMGVWGAPIAQEDHTERAVRCALDMMAALDDFNRFRVANGEAAINVGCGIDCGEVVAAYMGSTKTLSYTVIGDTVNTSSRLCSAAGPSEILVTDPVMFKLGHRLRFEERPAASLKGKARPVPIYRLTGLD